MSAATRPAAVALALLLSHAALASDCPTTGGSQPPIGPVTPHALPLAPAAVQPTLPLVAAPAAPQVRITVVDAMPPSAAAVAQAKPSAPTARITLVADTPADESKTVASTATDETQDDTAKLADATPSADEKEPEIDPALKGLVGTWLAVARHGDGELSTVELQLDERGWAKFTVPGPDGKPSTRRQRVELEDDELKLTGPDAEITLGKLIEFDDRQLTLARSGGQITFVRP